MTNQKSEHQNLTNLIIKSVRGAQMEEVFFEEIYSNPKLTAGENEFLFFIKPEITSPSSSINLERTLTLIQNRIENFGFNLHNIKILSAKYLDKYDIIAQHYGVINRVSTKAKENLTESAAEKFTDIYGKTVHEVNITGALEFLDQYPEFNAYTLEKHWRTLESKKLGSGIYCVKTMIGPDVIYLINGFHPKQLKHFTEKGKSILVMTLSGNLSWAEARNNFAGATDPILANEGSLRRDLMVMKSELGLPEISQGVNGVHLSAGPVEALIELKRFNSDFSGESQGKDFSDFSFGVKLMEMFNQKQFDKIVSNTNLIVDGKSLSIFELTEDKDSTRALSILKELI
jgi:nucleoside diphosphate kinase